MLTETNIAIPQQQIFGADFAPLHPADDEDEEGGGDDTEHDLASRVRD